MNWWNPQIADLGMVLFGPTKAKSAEVLFGCSAKTSRERGGKTGRSFPVHWCRMLPTCRKGAGHASSMCWGTTHAALNLLQGLLVFCTLHSWLELSLDLSFRTLCQTFKRQGFRGAAFFEKIVSTWDKQVHTSPSRSKSFIQPALFKYILSDKVLVLRAWMGRAKIKSHTTISSCERNQENDTGGERRGGIIICTSIFSHGDQTSFV